MKHLKTMTLLFSLACSVLLASPTYAASKVQFEGGAEDFVFYPDGEWTDTDLFGGLQGVMPGDTRTETIEVRNTSGEHNFVRIYLRAIPHGDGNPVSEEVAEVGETVATMTNFLSKLSMTVKNGEQIISQAPANEPGGLTNNVLLGSFQKDSNMTLKVTVKVPEDLGNDYQYRAGEIDWVWTAEGVDAGAPDTGRGHEAEIRAVGIVTILFVLTTIGCGYYIYRRKNC